MSSEKNKNVSRSLMFETILSSPGMQERRKVQIHASRKNIVAVCRLIEAYMLTKDHPFDDDIIAALPDSSREEIQQVFDELLKKADLVEFYERLRRLDVQDM